MKKGFFITFEGADGCGKTTQIEMVSDYLNKKNIKNIVTREPGATDLGSKLREILLHYDKPVSDKCETFLYLADRAQHVEKFIKPNVACGRIVLCDRYTDSTLAYQGWGRQGDIEKIKYLNDLATDGLKPDLTIVFDVDSYVAQKRLGETKDRLESEGIEFHKKIRNGYLEIARLEPKRIKVVDGNKPVEEVFKNTKKIVEELIN